MSTQNRRSGKRTQAELALAFAGIGNDLSDRSMFIVRTFELEGLESRKLCCLSRKA